MEQRLVPPQPCSQSTPTTSHRSAHRMTLELPLSTAAKLAALQEIHRNKSLHQILLDLISLGLARVEAAVNSPDLLLEAEPDPRHEPVYLLMGPFAEFRHLIVKHHRRMEREASADEAEPTTSIDPYDLNDGTM